LKVMKLKGVLNLGGKIQSIYNFAKKDNKKIKKIFLKKNKKNKKNIIPFNSSMNLSKLNKFFK